MRKLVSAATSLVMAATMVSAVAPVVAGAADAKKGLSILTYKEATLPSGVTANGATVNVSADAVKAGDVTIPIGIYLTEGTTDTRSMSVQVTVNSDKADVKNIKFTKGYTPGVTDFFSAEKAFKDNAGNEFTTNKVVSYAGSWSKRSGYQALGNYGAVVVDDKQDAAGTENAYFALSWSDGGKKYTEWFGEKSDTYPVVVFDVTLPKGIANGEYTLDYCNYINEMQNASCLIESVEKYESINNKNLDLNTLTIKVGDTDAPAETTTTASTPAQTTTTAAKPDGSTTTTTAKQEVDLKDADYHLYFADEDGNKGPIKAEAGSEVYVDLVCEQVKDTAMATAFSIDIVPDTIVFSGVEDNSPAMGVMVNRNFKEGNVNAANPGSSGDGIAVNGTIIMYTFTVPAGTPDGLYAINVVRAYMPDKNKEGLNVVVDNATAYIQVGDAITPPETTTTQPAATTTTAAPVQTTTTAAPVQTTTTASAPATTTTESAPATTTGAIAPGDVLYGDTNCDKQVKINDVVLLNKYLNDAKSYNITAQGKINADCYNPKNGAELTAEDSKAIIQSIVHLVTLPVNK